MSLPGLIASKFANNATDDCGDFRTKFFIMIYPNFNLLFRAIVVFRRLYQNLDICIGEKFAESLCKSVCKQTRLGE